MGSQRNHAPSRTCRIHDLTKELEALQKHAKVCDQGPGTHRRAQPQNLQVVSGRCWGALFPRP